MKFESWTPALLPDVVRFWNRSFEARRNFLPLTPELFRRRVLAAGAFDPAGFIVARSGRRIVGVVHVGRRARRQGFVALLFVDPGLRKQGIGTRLWHRGLEAMRGAQFVSLVNGWENPFYGASRGRAPLWGSPWGIGVEWGDSATLKFLARKGHGPQSRAVQLALDLSLAPKAGRNPRPKPRAAAVFFADLRAVRAGLFGLYGIRGLRASARFDRASAKALLVGALGEMREKAGRSCEVLAYPDLRPEEHRLYLDLGFAPVASWAVF